MLQTMLLRFILLLSLFAPLFFSGCQSNIVRRVHFLEQNRQEDLAITELQALAISQPQNAEIQFELGRLQLKKENHVLMHRAFTKAKDLTLRYHLSIKGLLDAEYEEEMSAGVFSYQQKDFEEAVLHLSRAAKTDTTSLEAWRSFGHAAARSQNNPMAILAYQKAARLDPENIETLNNLGELLFRSDQFDKCLLVSLQLFNLDEEHVPAIKRIAYAYYFSGQYSDAVNWLEQLSLKKASLTVQKNLAIAYFRAKNFEMAKVALQQFASPEAPEIQIMLTEACLQTGDFEALLQWSEIAYDTQSDNVDLLVNMVYAYKQLGRPAEAAAILSQIEAKKAEVVHEN